MTAEQVAAAAAASYPLLVAAVLVGSVVPVVPTGAVVSAAAALAVHGGGESLVGVLVLAAVAAYLGDYLIFMIARGGLRGVPDRVASRLHMRDPDLARRLHEHGWQVLVVARLMPAARIPAVVAAGLTHYPAVKFALAQAAAVVSWAAMYAAFGVVGGGAFANPLVGMIVAAAGVLVATGLVRLGHGWRRRRATARRGPGPAAAAG